MALELNTAGEVKQIRGIYNGQTSWEDIGTIFYSSDTSPFILGAFPSDSSATVNIFFDPSRSQQAGAFGPDYTGLVQVSEFFLNHYSLPLEFYERRPGIPDTNKFIEFGNRDLPSQVWFVDVPRVDSADTRVKNVYFPYWQLQNDATYDTANFLRFPQAYGGNTRFNPKTGNSGQLPHGENLVAYLTSNQTMNLGNLPSKYTLEDYIDALDLTDFEILQTPLATSVSESQIDQYLISQNLIPQSFLSFFSSVVKVFKTEKNRLLLQYTTPAIRGEEIFKIVTLLLIAENPDQEGYYAVFPLDPDLYQEFNESKSSLPPDFETIKRYVEKDYSYSFYKFKTMEISKRMLTYACSIKYFDDTRKIDIKLMEGISWQISNNYTQEKQWDNVSLPPPEDVTTDTLAKWKFKTAIERFYSKLFKELGVLPYSINWL